MNLAGFRRALLEWFEQNRRPLPWRQEPTPYHTWVSEVMLQQTQAATVVPYYVEFMRRFPTIEALAAASADEVLKAWEGMGYYRRAHNLQRAAQIIVAEYDGRVPADARALAALPGIGRYTAGAIRSIAFGQPVPVLDGNVKRVLARLDDLEASIDDARVEQRLWARSAELLDPDHPGDFNQAVMELGATICLPKKPACLFCPVQSFCLGHARGTQYERPVRNRRRAIPHFDVAAGVIWHQREPDCFLIAQRPLDGMLGGLWEFPGGKKKPDETLPAALERELAEELGIQVAVGDYLASIEHAYTHFRITLHAFHARHSGGEPQALGVADWRWVKMTDLDDFAFARTDRRIIDALQAWLDPG